MWVLKFLPNWVFYGTLLVGIIGLLVSKFIPSYYRSAAQAVAAAFVVFGLFMTGAIYDNEAWVARVKEMEAKVAAAEAQSKEETVKIETKYINRTNTIRLRGEQIVNYVDREIVKYDSTCVIPKEFIQAHNQAAEMPK